MRVTRYPLAVLAAVVLIANLLCAQICDINCAFYGCSLSSPVKAAGLPVWSLPAACADADGGFTIIY